MTTGMKVEMDILMKGVRSERPGNCEREVKAGLLRSAFIHQTNDLSITLI